MNDASVDVRTKFRLDLAPKRGEFYDTIDYAALGDDINDFVGVLLISGPNGTIYENTDFGNPDITPATSRQSVNLITLPVDPQSNYEVYKGNYTVKYTIRNTSTLDEFENTFVYGFQFTEPTIEINVDSGPFTAKLRSHDITDYGSNIDTLVRIHTLHYPEGILPSPPADIVTSLADYEVDPVYSNLWEITVDTSVLYIQADKLEYSWQGSLQVDHCVFGLCLSDVYDGMDTLLETYLDLTTTNPAEASRYQDRLTKSNSALVLLDIAWREDDYEECDKQIYVVQEQLQISGISTCTQGGTSYEVVPCGAWGGGGITPPAYIFESGVNESAGVVRFGGALTQNAIINGGVYTTEFNATDGTDTAQVQIASTGLLLSASNANYQNKIQITPSGLGMDFDFVDIGTPANSKGYALGPNGLVEDADYSADYSIRSLVSKDYVDNNQNWGSQVVVSDASLSGDGTAGDPLLVASPFPGFDTLNADYGYIEPTHAFAEITSTPTTIAGYGITDAVDAFLGLTDTPTDYTGHAAKLIAVNAGETALEFVSTSGYVPDTGGTFTGPVIIFTTNDYPLVLKQEGGGESPGTPDASINRIQFQDNDGDIQGYLGMDASGNLTLSTNFPGQFIQSEGDFDVQGDISVTGTVDAVDIAAFKAAYDIHTHTFASLTAKPTTLSGYGITDAMSNTANSWGTEFSVKAAGVIADILVIEDSADGWAKKYVTLGDIPSGAVTFLALSDVPSTYSGQGGYFPQVNVGENALEFVNIDNLYLSVANGTVNSLTEKTLPVVGDVLLIEDSADSYQQKKILIGSLPTPGGGGGGTGVTFTYRFDNTIAQADPTAGRFRFNNSTPANITEIYLDYLAWNSLTMSTLFDDIVPGSHIYIQQIDDTSKGVLFDITTAPVDETGYYSIAVTYVSDSGSIPDNNADCGLIFEPYIIDWRNTAENLVTTGDITTGEVLYTDIITEANPAAGVTIEEIQLIDQYLANVFHINFDTVNPNSYSQEGRVWWNPDDFTINIATGLGPTLQVGQEMFVIVYNDTGVQIDNGSSIYPVGSVSGRPSVALANAETHVKIAGVILVSTMDIPDGSIGLATTGGKVRGVNTSTFSLGDTVWVSADTDGAITNVKPEFPDYAIQLGGVTVVDPVNGELQIGISGEATDTVINFFNGVFRESFDFFVTSDGVTITGSLDPTNGHDDMTMIFSDGFTILDTSPAVTIVLTAGTDDIPQTNYVYIPKTTKVLTVSTSDWPTAEHIKVATVVLRTAVTSQTDGALRNQNWNDHLQSTTSNQGHLSHITERVRQLAAKWNSGVEAVMTIDSGPTPDDVWISSTSGDVYQMHRQVFPAQDTETGDDIHVVNNFANPYVTETNLNTQILDALGNTLNNFSFSFVLWGICNRTGEPSHLMLNLPTGHYAFAAPANAVEDASNYSVYTIPKQFEGVGFLIARFTLTYKNDVWVLYETEDLRGRVPNTSAGGGVGGGGVTTFTALSDVPSSYLTYANSIPVINSAETGIEFSAMTFDSGYLYIPDASNAGIILSDDAGVTDTASLIAFGGDFYIEADDILRMNGKRIITGSYAASSFWTIRDSNTIPWTNALTIYEPATTNVVLNIENAGSIYMPALGDDDTEDHVVAINDSTGLLTKRSIESIVVEAKNIIHIAKAEVLYTNTSQTTIITLPTDAVIWDIGIESVIAFNGSGTDLLDVGITGDGDKFISNHEDIDIAPIFRSMSATSLTVTNEVPHRMTGSTNITFTYTDQNSDASAGQAFVYIHYSLH